MMGTRQITVLLRRWAAGDLEVLDELTPLVIGELLRLAGALLRKERAGHSLQPTALVNELYLRLLGQPPRPWRNRAHFFGFAAATMRHILVDHARAQRRLKRGGGGARIALEEVEESVAAPEVDLLALDGALAELTRVGPRLGRIVELRAFVGLSLEETAAVVGVSVATVSRDWALARAWLYRHLGFARAG